MTENDWMHAVEPWAMLDFLRGKVSGRKQRLRLVACCQRVAHLLRDSRSTRALEVATRHADGLATDDELSIAWSDAWHVVTENLARFRQAEPEGLHSLYLEDMAARVAADVASLDSIEWLAVNQDSPRECSPDDQEKQFLTQVLRELHGNPFRTVVFDSALKTDRVTRLAEGIYESESFSRLPVLADALEEAGCVGDEILAHLRANDPHVRGCWALDLILFKDR